MVPLTKTAARYARGWLGPTEAPGLLALRHALTYDRPGLWGDDARTPRSVILVREGDGQLEAFGAGEPGPAVAWLLGQDRKFTLLAPEPWLEPVVDRIGPVDRPVVETWAYGNAGQRDPAELPPDDLRPQPKARTWRLNPAHKAAFDAFVPPWGLRGWGAFDVMIGNDSSAFGVFNASELISASWVFDRADNYASLAVHTLPRFRRLGLGYAAAISATWRLERRRETPLWSAPSGHSASLALAGQLGFTHAASETLIRWPPGPPAESEGEGEGEAVDLDPDIDIDID